MSEFVGFVVPTIIGVEGLQEIFASWGDERSSFEPPRYAYGRLVFIRVPLAPHVVAILPSSLSASGVYLELNDALVRDWEQRSLEAGVRHTLQSFATSVAKGMGSKVWAFVFDPSVAGQTTRRHCDATNLVKCAEEVLQSAAAREMLTILIVGHETS
jgi:hypothetical protein